MPSGLTEMFNQTTRRTMHDLSRAKEARLLVNVGSVAGAAGSEIRIQYSSDQTSWSYLDGASGPGAAINAAGLRTSPWVNLAAGATGNVYLRAVGIGGNGAADPRFGTVELQIR